MLNFLERKLGGRVSVERVVSGSGIPNIYEFLSQKYPDLIDPIVDREIALACEFKVSNNITTHIFHPYVILLLYYGFF